MVICDLCGCAFDLRRNGCCLFDAERDEIICVYTGEVGSDDLDGALRERLPVYMLPNRYERPQSLPMTINDKIDRVRLTRAYIGSEHRPGERMP